MRLNLRLLQVLDRVSIDDDHRHRDRIAIDSLSQIDFFPHVSDRMISHRLSLACNNLHGSSSWLPFTLLPAVAVPSIAGEGDTGA
jgi:hypothetical protein